MCDRPLLAQMQRPRHPINLQQHTVTLQGAPAAKSGIGVMELEFPTKLS